MVSEAKKRTNMAYDREHTKLIGMKLNLKTDADILAFLATKENVQGYLKDLIRKDMKGAKTMTYKIKPEFLDLWGSDATEETVLTDDDIEMITRGWDKTPADVMDQLIPLE